MDWTNALLVSAFATNYHVNSFLEAVDDDILNAGEKVPSAVWQDVEVCGVVLLCPNPHLRTELPTLLPCLACLCVCTGRRTVAIVERRTPAAERLFVRYSGTGLLPAASCSPDCARVHARQCILLFLCRCACVFPLRDTSGRILNMSSEMLPLIPT